MTGNLEPISPPAPIDLARESDFGLGAMAVSPSTREVTRGDWREQLEPRVMQVLVALAQAGGRVVSRDELIARCWEGRMVGEDAINRAIGRLRRLSEADAGASFVIETIARVGFRLKAATASVAALPYSAGLVTRRPRRWLWLAAGLVVAALAGAAGWWFWPSPHWSVESSRPFLSTLALEDDPAFSPDSTRLAYTSGADGGDRKIYVRNLSGGDGIRISNDGTADISPSWSSDGARIAYVGMQAGRPCHIMVATVPAGAVREVGRCVKAAVSSLAWQPGTGFLYFSERGGLAGDTITRLDIDSGAQQTTVRMAHLFEQISSLHCSPDGKWLAYLVRRRGLVIRNLASDEEKTLGSVSRQGQGNNWLTWSADSRSVFVATASDVGSEVDAFPADGSPSYRVYATALRIGRLAAGENMLAMQTDISRMNLARPVSTAAGQPDVMETASGFTWSPSFAPDGTLAFLSNRSGSNAIWLKKSDGASAVLYDGGAAPLDQVRFSPDGSRLALVVSAPSGIDVKIMSRSGASLSSFSMPSLGVGLPSWTPDGKGLLVFDRKDKRTWRIDVDNPRRRSPFAPPHWVGIAVRPQGMFATRADAPGIWRIDSAITKITAKYPASYSPSLAFKGDDVLVPQFPQDDTPRLLAQPVKGGTDVLLGYAPGAFSQGYFQSAFAVNPVTGGVVYTALLAHDTNIDLLTLARH